MDKRIVDFLLPLPKTMLEVIQVMAGKAKTLHPMQHCFGCGGGLKSIFLQPFVHDCKTVVLHHVSYL